MRQRQLKHVVYEENSEAIISDLLSIGQRPTAKKWNIPQGSISKLAARWLTPEQKEIVANATQAALPQVSVSKVPVDGRLPALPEFSNTWEPLVQHKWLEVYEKIYTEVHNKE